MFNIDVRLIKSKIYKMKKINAIYSNEPESLWEVMESTRGSLSGRLEFTSRLSH